MNTCLTLSLVVIVCMTVTAEDMPKPDPLTANCMHKISDDTSVCWQQLLDLGIDVIKFKNLKGKACCLLWKVPECTRPLVQTKCSPDQIKAMEDFKERFVKYIDENQCKGFEDQSKACEKITL